MRIRQRRSLFAIQRHKEETAREGIAPSESEYIPVLIPESDYERTDFGIINEYESAYDYNNEQAIDENSRQTIHDRASSVQKTRENGIRPRAQLVNLITDVADSFLRSAPGTPDKEARIREIQSARENLHRSFRKIDRYIADSNRELLEDLHHVLSSAFLIGLASDRVGMSETDAKRYFGAKIIEKARSAALSAAGSRHKKIDEIVWLAICDKFKSRNDIKKIGNSDTSANLLMDDVKRSARENDISIDIKINTIRQSIKRLSADKKGGIRRRHIEKWETL